MVLIRSRFPENYDYVMCDSKTLLNRHLACGTTFDRSIVNLNFELDEDKEKLCRYRESCVSLMVFVCRTRTKSRNDNAK